VNNHLLSIVAGSYPLQLTNAWNGTKLLFDEKIPEIKAFLERFSYIISNAC
jgi:hypothetical protein